jgi:hypothetical protein
MTEQQDNFDLEVSALESSPSQTTGDAIAPSDSNSAHPATPPTRQVSLAPRTRAQRVWRTGSIVAILTAFLLTALLLPSGNREAVLSRLTPPTPTTTPVPQPSDDAFLWEHSVPWGQLLIDGKPGPIVSGSALGQEGKRFPEEVAFYLGRGPHTIEYHADGFPTVRCRVTVPYSRDDTCPLDRQVNYGDMPLLRVLDLQATIDRLSPNETKALIQATQEQLVTVASALPAGTLRVGDHYMDAQGQVRQVTSTEAPLTMTPQFHLTTSVTTNDGVTCVTLCTGTAFGIPYSAKGWSLLAPVQLRWRYTRADGQTLLDEGPSALLPAVRSVLVHVLASSPAAGRWRIEVQQWPLLPDGQQTDPVLCLTADAYRQFVEVTSDQGMIGDGRVQWPYEASTPELGCLLAGSETNETDPNAGKPSGPMALLLYRAGALLTVNDQARKWYPMLPQANAHERALANAVAPAQLG